MSTELRELFDTAAESKPPYDLGERAVAAASRRRRRQAVVGAVVASAAMVLGVVVVSGQLQTDASPRPIDVANLPDALPAADGLPNLEPGMVDAASVAYLDGSFMVVVDASSGEAARLTFGPPPVDGGVESVAIKPTDVVLSSDGRRALVTVAGWYRSPPTLRVVDLATLRETVVPNLVPSDDLGAITAARPSVAAWANDSESFTCTCALKQGKAPQLVDVLIDEQDPTKVTVRVFAISPHLSPLQVTVGTAGLAVQLEPGGSWLLPDGSIEGGATVPAADAVALGRGEDPTYLALRGGGFTLGVVGIDFFDEATVTAEGDLTYSSTGDGPTGVTDVDAARDGFVVVTTNSLAWEGEKPRSDLRPRVVAIAADGAQRTLTTLPPGARTASFAADLF